MNDTKYMDYDKLCAKLGTKQGEKGGLQVFVGQINLEKGKHEMQGFLGA